MEFEKVVRLFYFLSVRKNVFAKLLVWLPVFLILAGMPFAFAQSTYSINIPSGAADINAPYYWQSEKDGNTDGEIHIAVGDTVSWENGDTAFHSVTSGFYESGPDGNFDSDLFGPGKKFKHTFDKLGEYPYYCSIHSWMTGTVFVDTQYRVLKNVGADVGDGSTTFDVEYILNRLVSEARINEQQNSITFSIVGNPQSADNTLTLLLPNDLISNPSIVWVDGKKISDFKIISGDNMNTLEIPLESTSKEVTIIGSSVVPEFGPLSMIVLAGSIISIIFIGFRKNLISNQSSIN